MPNIRILAKAVLRIFCSQNKLYIINSSTPWSLTICQILRSLPKWFFRYFVHKFVPIKMPMSVKGKNSTENLQNRFQKLISSSTSWSVIICQYQDPSLSGSLEILFTRLLIHRRKRGITPERQDRWRKKIRVRLFFMYMPHI